MNCEASKWPPHKTNISTGMVFYYSIPEGDVLIIPLRVKWLFIMYYLVYIYVRNLHKIQNIPRLWQVIKEFISGRENWGVRGPEKEWNNRISPKVTPVCGFVPRTIVQYTILGVRPKESNFLWFSNSSWHQWPTFDRTRNKISEVSVS